MSKKVELKNTYNESFYQKQASSSYKSATVVLRYLKSIYNFDSVVDVGCGVGTWLKAALDLGAKTIQGFDGNQIDDASLYVPREHISVVDLDSFIPKGNKEFDLGMSLEVAEHLEETSSERFVDVLTNYSDVVIFSAAIPGQTGTDHINCKPLDFWVDLFKQKNYICFDFIRKELMDDEEKIPNNSKHYIQNILIFVHKDKKDIFTSQNFKETPNPLMFYYHSIHYRILERVRRDANWLPAMFGIFNTKNKIIFVVFFIKLTFKVTPEKINKFACFIPVKKWRYKFRAKFE